MTMADTALAPAPPAVTFEGLARAGASVLRSPASGQPCVYWRVRIAQRLTDRSQLVHEIASEEAFELVWSGTGEGGQTGQAARPEVRVWLEPAGATTQAKPVPHRE